MKPIPEELCRGPFTPKQAASHGVTERMLNGQRFERVLPHVWKVASHEMTGPDWLSAARLALPGRAVTTGLTRIQQLGLDFGPPLPLRFVIEGDHHLALPHVFLHRTAKLPPHDEHGVIASAAFVAYCAQARFIDAIKVGDWLLHHHHCSVESILDRAHADPWRLGSVEATVLVPHLDPASLSVRESETRALLNFAGLPTPETNQPFEVSPGLFLTPDLRYREHRTVVEYEGRQHQTDRGQYSSDIDRYEAYRRASIDYVLVTDERLRSPRDLVRKVHRSLVKNGYDGPAPEFGPRWLSLFNLVTKLVDPATRAAFRTQR